jgi:hypothetical protein
MTTYDNPWIYSTTSFTSSDILDNIGFVYLITDLDTNRLYIGKKIFTNKKAKPPLKGKTNRRITYVESDWKTYYGSNPTIQKIMQIAAPTRFSRQILHLCKTKSEMGYLETKELFDRSALLDDTYYNDWITCRITKKQLEKVRDRLS